MRPHDLLRLKPAAALLLPDAPAWVAPALARAPFVVVRRGGVAANRIPIGVRGERRDQRHPDSVDPADVIEAITPEDLARAGGWRSCDQRNLAVFAALDDIAHAAAEVDLVWGPGGSVGFELASGVPTAHAQSDLDLIVRPSTAHDQAALRRFRQRLLPLPLRIDIAIETAQGSVALDEWLASPQRVLIKTAHGPQLGAFVW